MIDKRQVMYDIERCISHVPDACRDCSHYTGTVGFGCMENLMSDILALLKEQGAVEKNKECHKDKAAVECLNAIQTINKYIDDEEDECGCTYWKDKKGYAFQADTGYFFEGLDNFEAYLIKRLRKAVK